MGYGKPEWLSGQYERYSYDEAAERRKRQALVTEEATWPPVTPGLWPLFYAYLGERGLDAGLAYENGWYPSNEAKDHVPRVVMPGLRTDGKIFWQARAMCLEEYRRYQSPSGGRGDAVIRVVPTDVMVVAQAALVEGPMDALAAAECGVLGIALMGNTPNVESLEHVAALIEHVSHLYVIADSDSLLQTTRTMTWLRLRTKAKAQLWYPYPYKDLAAMPLAARKVRFQT